MYRSNQAEEDRASSRKTRGRRWGKGRECWGSVGSNLTLWRSIRTKLSRVSWGFCLTPSTPLRWLHKGSLLDDDTRFSGDSDGVRLRENKSVSSLLAGFYLLYNWSGEYLDWWRGMIFFIRTTVMSLDMYLWNIIKPKSINIRYFQVLI